MNLEADMQMKLEILSQRCADTHTSDDVWEHLEEELAELLLAIKRVRRQRSFLPEVIEELIDVKIEINTVLTQLNMSEATDAMLARKLEKFETMLLKEEKDGKFPISRYRSIPSIYGDATALK
jgi:hypothetical protein